MRITHEESFSCGPAALFAWLEEPEKAMTWMKSVARTAIIHRSENKIGTTFLETIQDDKGSLEMRGTITGFQKDRLIAFHLDSPVNSLDIEYKTEPTSGGTRLGVASTIRWKFPVSVLSVMIGKKMRTGILAQLKSELSELRRLCEPHSAGGAGVSTPP